MAFTNPVVTKITDGLVRITADSLASGATGTIGLFPSTAGGGVVLLPEGCEWGAYTDVTLQDAVQVQINPTSDVSNYGIPMRVVKTGSTPEDFLITITNDSAATASAALELYVRYH